MTARLIPRRHWRSYGDEPLPTGREALDEPFRAVPVVVPADPRVIAAARIECSRRRTRRERHAAPRHLDRMRHDGCGGRAGKVELLTDIEAASSRPVRRIVLITNPMLQPDSIVGAECRRREPRPQLPTPRTTLAASYVAVPVWCKSCRHQAQADLQKLIDAGMGDVPLTRLRFRCSNSSSSLTDFGAPGGRRSERSLACPAARS